MLLLNFQFSYVDPCSNNLCVNGGTCSSSGGQFTCTCPPEYTGQVCNVTVNPCDSNPCENGGICSPGIGLAYTCSCSAGYTLDQPVQWTLMSVLESIVVMEHV